jgi:hypothetical protein
MTTHEREITEPVDLCLPDGRRLNPDARGWSRTPLHRANLKGGWGRTKRWDYWALLAGDLVVSVVYADVDYLGLADVWWCDLATGESGGRGLHVPFARGFWLPENPGTAPLHVHRAGFALDMTDDANGTTHLRASWRERDGRPGSLEATVALPPGHESLNVVIPWDVHTFQYTSKHQARPAHGTLEVGDRDWEFGAADGGGGAGGRSEAWGVLDVGRGRWPYRTRWNWGGGAGRTRDGRHVVGLQLGGKWTEGTGATENGVLVDGKLTKLGRELRWSYDWDEPLKPWRVEDPDGRLRLELTPRHDKHTRLRAIVMATETHQVFGTWAGSFRTEDDTLLEFEGMQGFAEESRSRW